MEKLVENGSFIKQTDNVKDIKKLPLRELLNLKKRSEYVLKSTGLRKNLPDKGAQLECAHKKLLSEIESRESAEKSSKKIAELNSFYQKQANSLEWRQKPTENDDDESIGNEEDDTQESIWEILAKPQMSSKRVVKVAEKSRSLITDQDMQEIKEFEMEKLSQKSEESQSQLAGECNDAAITAINAQLMQLKVTEKMPEIIPKLQAILDKQKEKDKTTDPKLASNPFARHHLTIANIDTMPAIEKFKPYKTTISNVHDPIKEATRMQKKNWECTAATPPLLKHPGVKFITLEESVEILKEQMENLSKMHEEVTAERSKARMQRRATYLEADSQQAEKNIPTMLNVEGVLNLNSCAEVYDDANVEYGGTVTYSVPDD